MDGSGGSAAVGEHGVCQNFIPRCASGTLYEVCECVYMFRDGKHLWLLMFRPVIIVQKNLTCSVKCTGRVFCHQVSFNQNDGDRHQVELIVDVPLP